MLYGARQSRRPPDEQHPFGHGHELYFWTLIVGVLIFGLGGGMSIVTGFMHILHAAPPENIAWNYAIIATAMVFEAISWRYGWKAFAAERRGRGVVETIRETKNPTTFAVLLEDSAALLGLAIAFVGIFLSVELGMPWIDGASSIMIGVLLCLVAIVMVYESKGLLVGEGVRKSTLEEVRAIVRADPAVDCVEKLLTIYLGPEEILLAIELRFRADTRLGDIRQAVARIRRAIQARHPRIRRIFLDATSIGEPA
jgi:cation diffusion facilitator family transporter